jgi:hypothetical protein
MQAKVPLESSVKAIGFVNRQGTDAAIQGGKKLLIMIV